MPARPILLNSCAQAATAAEARYRINAPVSAAQVSVIALDHGAESVIRRVAQQDWKAASFFAYEAAPSSTGNGSGPEAFLRAFDGSPTRLSDQLAGADITVMVLTADDGADAAAAIGEACHRRGIMTAGLMLGDETKAGAAMLALRSHARVLMVSRDDRDVSEVLTALRA